MMSHLGKQPEASKQGSQVFVDCLQKGMVEQVVVLVLTINQPRTPQHCGELVTMHAGGNHGMQPLPRKGNADLNHYCAVIVQC